jgi:hypothetical protein
VLHFSFESAQLYGEQDNNLAMKKSIHLIALAANFACLVACVVPSAARANDLDYLHGIRPPKELGQVDAVGSARSTYYLKTPNFFGSEKLSSVEGRLKSRPAGEQTVYVQFKSAVVTAGIQEQLKLRGVKVAPSKDAAYLVLGGEIVYQDQYFPNPPRRIAFTEKMDPQSTNVGTEKGAKTVSLAALELAPAYLVRGSSPSAFGAALLTNLVEVTGVSKLFTTPAEKTAESFLLLDCYDKASRTSTSCISDDQLLLSYRGKIRVQAVDVKAFLGRPGDAAANFQRARIVARVTEGRPATDSRLIELLADAMQELVSGLGNEPAISPASDAINEPQK